MSTPKTSAQLYRDCLRLVRHIAGSSSPKAAQLTRIVGAQFRANAGVNEPTAIHSLKQQAERSLSSYLLYQRAKLDPKIAAAASAQADAFEDDEHGNLVRVVGASSKSPNAPAAAAAAAVAAKRKAVAKLRAEDAASAR